MSKNINFLIKLANTTKIANDSDIGDFKISLYIC